MVHLYLYCIAEGLCLDGNGAPSPRWGCARLVHGSSDRPMYVVRDASQQPTRCSTALQDYYILQDALLV
eukprot:scaffold206682_cov31-Tisochrysis_lutea.AAC.1